MADGGDREEVFGGDIRRMFWSRKQDVVFAVNGHTTDIKRNQCAKRKEKEMSALSIKLLNEVSVSV